MSPGVEYKGESVANGAQNGTHTNGTQANGSQANGTKANGSQANGHHTQDKDTSKKLNQSTHAKRTEKKKASSIGALMQLRKASQRPLPTERRDGTYRTILKRPTLMQDLKSFGIEGEQIVLSPVKCMSLIV